MELSIIIPIYNTAKYLEDCLQSLSSKFPYEFEVLLIDDGSTDNSPEICQRFVSTHDNARYIRQKNQGLSGARNTGINNSKGNYLLFLDSDDYLYPGSLDTIISEIKNSTKDLYIGRAYKFIDGCQQLTLCQCDYSGKEILKPCEIFDSLNSQKHFWFAAWIIICQRNFIIDNQLYFYNGILHEDELWVPTVIIHAQTIGILNFGFYCYRTNREGSIVAMPNIKREFDKLLVIDELNKSKGVSIMGDKIIADRQSSLIFGIILSLYKHKSNNKYSDLLKLVKSKLAYLDYGKYKIMYQACRLFGVNRMSSIANKLL